MAAPIREGFTEANGLRFHYLAAGEPGRKLVLFLHGFPEFAGAWRAQLEEFGRDHLAIAPDLRGYNLSDKPQDVAAYRAKHLVDDVRQIAAQFTDRPFVLVAHDWGGAIGWNIAAAHPELVERLVIVNSPHAIAFARGLGQDPAQQRASAYMNLLRSPKAERVLSENGYGRLVAMALEQWGAAPVDRSAYLEAWSQPGALTGMLNWYRASPLYPPTEGDPGAAKLTLDPGAFTVRVPTLVIWGMSDTALLPSLLDGLEACVPDLRIERIPEGTHWIVHEQPARVNRLIRRFIAD
jgi:pimeloyl-ACP methyl ester carboxylesterase